MFQQPDEDDDDAVRLKAVFAKNDRVLCDRLFAAAKPGSYEAYFLLRDPATYDSADRATLHRMAWFYRRRLPKFLRPARNPDDPIVRERGVLDG